MAREVLAVVVARAMGVAVVVVGGAVAVAVADMSSRHKMSLKFWPDGFVSPTQN